KLLPLIERMDQSAIAKAVKAALAETQIVPERSEAMVVAENPYSTRAELLDERGLVDAIASRLAESGGEILIGLTLIDQQTQTEVSHRDVGIGVSQVLPILVSAVASKNMLIAMEQPELHLHPALQAELGDVFIESALGENKNTFLIETHSEHLILRLLRRIRETAAGELPTGKMPLRPEDIAVLYVKPGAEGSEVIALPVNAEGDFDAPWPDGFFAERAKELFSLGDDE
ncbi:MAG: DUF3696 domain-containing protein, partial [Chthoniobacteraceae bacterium]